MNSRISNYLETGIYSDHSLTIFQRLMVEYGGTVAKKSISSAFEKLELNLIEKINYDN